MPKNQVIWKYSLDISFGERSFKVEMPSGAHIIDIHAQGAQVCIWALVKGEEYETLPTETREFEAVFTGEAVSDEDRVYLGTAHLEVSGLVIHVFEKAELN